MPKKRTKLALMSAHVLAVFVWSAIHPHDYFTWFLELLPAILGIGILTATYTQRFTSPTQ